MNNLFEFQNERYYTSEFQDFNSWEPNKQNDDDGFPMLINISNSRPSWKHIKSEETKESFEKNLLNIFWTVRLSKEKIFVQKDENKVRIKIYHYLKFRSVGEKFYRVSTNLHYITYNYNTNSLYTGHMKNFHKKRKFTKSVRRSSVSHQPLSQIRSELNLILRNSFNQQLIKDVSDYSSNIINTFLNSIPGIENYTDIYPSDNRLYKLILDKYQVKLPNNWESLIFTNTFPKMRVIRKFKNKYIDAVMSLSNLRGDKVRKVLHQVTSYNPQNLKASYILFGESFILQQPDTFIKKLLEYNFWLDSPPLDRFSKKEKKNIFEIFKLVIDSQLNTNTFFDHVHMYRDISRFEPIKWKSNNLETFQTEHLDWTERKDFYTKGDYKRVYDDKLTNLLKLPIINDSSIEYYPTLLTTSREYNEESFTQSNCVKGYITKAGSIIVSLRKNSKESNERATIEYSLMKVKDKIALNRVQTLGRFNQKLNDDWITPIDMLDNLLNNLFKNEEMSLPKINVKFGHKEFQSTSLFTDNSFRKYLMKDIHGNDVKYLSWDRDVHNNTNTIQLTPIEIPIIDVPNINLPI